MCSIHRVQVPRMVLEVKVLPENGFFGGPKDTLWSWTRQWKNFHSNKVRGHWGTITCCGAVESKVPAAEQPSICGLMAQTGHSHSQMGPEKHQCHAQHGRILQTNVVYIRLLSHC